VSVQAPENLQRADELPELLDLYRERAPRKVLEIGVYLGGTLYHWLHEARAGAEVVAVNDHDLVSEVLALWTPDGVSSTFICGDSNSQETAESAREHGPFDWIFIDAGHYLYEVRADWELYSPMCAEGGVVVLHDVSRDDECPHIQVWELWAELVETHTTQLIGIDTGVVYL
jgi:predicted O-methyltransferase YrrM